MGVPGSRSAALLRGRQKEGGPHSPGESLAARRTGYPECGIHLPSGSLYGDRQSSGPTLLESGDFGVRSLIQMGRLNPLNSSNLQVLTRARATRCWSLTPSKSDFAGVDSLRCRSWSQPFEAIERHNRT